MSIDSAYLIQHPANRWELRDVEMTRGCFNLGYRPGKLLASGSREACEGAARLLGFRIDVIRPKVPEHRCANCNGILPPSNPSVIADGVCSRMCAQALRGG